MKDLGYVLWCYGDPYIVDFEEIIEHPKVSIILPVYNKGWCVEAALRSLQRQTLKEIEIICVDDGSSDDSVTRIKNYQQHDTRIKLIKNSRNRGTLYARAHGIRKATGDYVMFLDPDDLYATNDIVGVAYNKCIELDVDVVCFGACISREQSLRLSSLCEIMKHNVICDDKNHFFINIARCVCNKCVKRESCLVALSMISDEMIKQHICYSEDWLFTYALSLCIKNYVCVREYGYFYNLNSESICTYSNMNFPFERAIKRADDIFKTGNVALMLSRNIQGFLLQSLKCRIEEHKIFGPYTDEQLQQLYDIYMRINFDNEHKAKLSEYLKDGME